MNSAAVIEAAVCMAAVCMAAVTETLADCLELSSVEGCPGTAAA